MNKKIAGVVVLYNPDASVLDNINSYIRDLDILYVVDNSDTINEKLISSLQSINNIKYINNNGNLGIAKALNIGAVEALKNEYEWLLTMDQDSKASTSMINDMLQFLYKSNLKNIGIISPYHNIEMGPLRGEGEYATVLSTMTSGNLLNLHAFEKVGAFLEEYFIDYVDLEYCLRLNSEGYKVIVLNNILLEHNLGNISTNKFMFMKFKTSNHSPIRRYYMTRNRLYLRDKYKNTYKEFIKHDIKGMYIETIKIILGERNKFSKLKNIFRGYIDYKKNIYGKKK